MEPQWTNPPEGNCIFQVILSLKRSLDSRNLWNGFIVSAFVLIERGWLWTCMTGKKHNQLFRNVYPGKPHKGVFSLWPPFWVVSVVELQVEAAAGETGTQGKFLSDIFPSLASGSFLSTLHAQYWILSISTSEYNICRRGRQWELPLGYYGDSYLFSILMKN